MEVFLMILLITDMYSAVDNAIKTRLEKRA
jgi:hypothetical protein